MRYVDIIFPCYVISSIGHKISDFDTIPHYKSDILFIPHITGSAKHNNWPHKHNSKQNWTENIMFCNASSVFYFYHSYM